MTYIITGTLNYASQANRDAAKTRVETALGSYVWSGRATTLSAGVSNPSSTTMTISIVISSEDPQVVKTVYDSVMTQLVSSGRHTSGWIGMNKLG